MSSGNLPRIIYVHHGSELGGAPVSLANTIRAVKKSGRYEIGVLCVSPAMVPFFQQQTGVTPGFLCNPGQTLGRALIGYVNVFNPLVFMRLAKDILLLPSRIYRQYRTLAAERPSIVHLNSSILISTAIAARLAGHRLVWHVREMPTGGRWNLRRQLAGWLIRRLAHTVIAISPLEKRLVGGENDESVVVVYNFIDLSRFNEACVQPGAARSRFRIPADAKVVVSLGGVSPRKGTAELLEMMQFMDGGVVLLIAGPDDSREPESLAAQTLTDWAAALEDILVGLGLKACRTWNYGRRVNALRNRMRTAPVMFSGPLSDVREVLADADVLVFAGTTAHFPRPIYEAWAFKKPVVAFDLDGARQNVDDGVDGVLVRPRTGKSLATAIDMLLRDPERCSELGNNGYAKTMERFCQVKNGRLIMQVYDILIGARTTAEAA